MSFLQPSLRALCVFCGASSGVKPIYSKAAEQLGITLARNGIRLVYGGGGIGLMGALARACLDAGGEVTGIIPQHLVDIELSMEGLTERVIVPDMHTRKRAMFDQSDAFVVLPGGFGTMDETFEILTWKQLGLHTRPVIIADIDGYWTPFLRFNESMSSEGFVSSKGLGNYAVVPDVDRILPEVHKHLSSSDKVHEQANLF